MTVKNWLDKEVLDWLLAPEDVGARYLALRELLELQPNDVDFISARQAAHTNGPIATILGQMLPGGYWAKPGPGYLPKYRSTVWSITLLAQLGASAEEDERIRRACAYLLDYSMTTRGQFSVSGAPSGTVVCLQGSLCWSLLEMNYHDDRLALALEWMARAVTGEGVAPRTDKKAELRYYAGTCGPRFACGSNNNQPCAWGAAKVMLAFGNLPKALRTPLIERAIAEGVDFLLGTDPAKAGWPTGYASKPSSNWWKFGFPVFYITDILQVAEALVNLGYGSDPRLANALELVRNKQDRQGRWMLEYDYTGKTWLDFGKKKQANKWVTLRALKVLKKVTKS